MGRYSGGADMIVTCGQCKTRFKIPEGKVTPEKGVKVRCTKCGHTFRVFRDASSASIEPGPQHVPSPHESPHLEVDPFERFGSMSDLGSGPSAPRGEPKAPAPFDFSAIAPPSGPSTPTPGAFDFSVLTMPPSPRPATAPSLPASTPEFDFSSLGFPQGLASAAPDEQALPPPSSLDALSPPSTDWFDTPTDSSEAASEPTAVPPSAAAFPVSQGAPPQTADGFFGAPLEVEARRPLLDLPDEIDPEAARGALFNLPAVPRGSEAHSALSELAPLTERLPASPVPSLAQGGVVAAQPIEVPRQRIIAGVMVNVVIGLFLVAGVMVIIAALLNEGNLNRETLSLKGLTALFGATSRFPASDISNGLYETKAGRAVFFVRGQITNRSSAKTRIVVQADIVESAAVVRSARGFAGAVPSPEELYELELSEGDGLVRLAARLAPRAALLEPGATAGFLVAFAEYPPDLEDFRVRVSAQADPSEPTVQRH